MSNSWTLRRSEFNQCITTLFSPKTLSLSFSSSSLCFLPLQFEFFVCSVSVPSFFLFCGTSVLISSPILRISKFEVRRHRIRRNNEGLNWWQWCNVRFALFDTTMAFRTRVWWFKLRVFDMPFNSTNFSLICGFSCSKLGSFVAVWSLGFWCEEHMGFRFALCVLFCCWIWIFF